jgi:hypothetical protein
MLLRQLRQPLDLMRAAPERLKEAKQAQRSYRDAQMQKLGLNNDDPDAPQF